MTGGEGMRLREVWQKGKALLETAGIPDVNFELGLLFEHTFCYNRVDLLEKGEEEAGEADDPARGSSGEGGESALEESGKK